MEKFYLKVKIVFILHKKKFNMNRPKENEWGASSFVATPKIQVRKFESKLGVKILQVLDG